MLETTKEFIEETNEIMDVMKKMMYEKDVLEDVDENTLKIYQISMKMVETSNKLLVEQAEIMESMNEKLDKLLLK